MRRIIVMQLIAIFVIILFCVAPSLSQDSHKKISQLGLSTDLMSRYFESNNCNGNGVFTAFSAKTQVCSFDTRWYSESEIRRRRGKSLLWTIIPIAIGITLALKPNQEDFSGPFIFTGLLIGPSMGYWGTGQSQLTWRYGATGIALRTVAMIPPLVFAIGAGLSSSGSSDYKRLIAYAYSGFALIAAWGIYDVFALPKRFKAKAQSLGLVSISVRPALMLVANGKPAAGVGFQLRF